MAITSIQTLYTPPGYALLGPLERKLPVGHALAAMTGVVVNVAGLERLGKHKAAATRETIGGLMSGSTPTPFAVHGIVFGRTGHLLIFNPTDPVVRMSMEAMHRASLMPFILTGSEDGFVAGAASEPLFKMALGDTAGHVQASHEAWLAHVRQQSPLLALVYQAQYQNLKRCDEVHVHIVVPMDEAHPMHALLREGSSRTLH